MTRKKKQEAEQKPEYEWRSDRPERPALYNARVDGKETVLQFRKCQMTGRMYWLYVDGSDVNPNAKVEWREGRVF